MFKNKNGITLIALIITIIVLLILAGVTISLVVGDNGILTQSKSSSEKTIIGREQETIAVSWNALITDKLANDVEITDAAFEQELIKNGNDVTVSYDADENYLVHFNDTEHDYIVDHNGKISDFDSSTMLAPATPGIVDETVTFHTEYGRIDVIWLSGTSNTVASSPNAPVLSGMTPVTWTLNGDTWEEDAIAGESYYSYTAGNGTEDNTSSMWANAKNSDGSYFVWIPRYAYRIIYYESETSTEITGYYDGYGQWRASDGGLRLALDSGIETVNYGGKKYIVHPAFCGESVGYDNGSWSENLTGFWVAKYEMSRLGATASSQGTGYDTAFLSVPNVRAAGKLIIGNMYNIARSYDISKESHLMKNSEWGAVVYLAHSQYGRNGKQINSNINRDCITGKRGTTTNYNKINGGKASTTGNVYGIYDMCGGAYEYVAAFNNTDSNDYETTNGNSFASTTFSSDKYATKYYNETNIYYGNITVCTYGKTGDATKEVYNDGMGPLHTKAQSKYWFCISNPGSLCSSTSPFIKRGNTWVSNSDSNFDCSGTNGAGTADNVSFRVVLCP